MGTIGRTTSSAIRNNLIVLLVILSIGLYNSSSAHAAKKETEKQSTKQTLFLTPEGAVKALVDAAKTKDRTALVGMLGPEAEKLLFSGDEVQDNEEMEELASAGKSSKLEKVNDDKFTFTVGEENWPFPIVKEADRWRFDTQAGIEEILNRRIGENEISVILTCRAYVLAQWQYFTEEETDKEGVGEYAQKFFSSPGKRDGLYWEKNE